MSWASVDAKVAVASFMDLFFGWRCVWWVIAAKIGRSIGSKDFVFVAKVRVTSSIRLVWVRRVSHMCIVSHVYCHGVICCTQYFKMGMMLAVFAAIATSAVAFPFGPFAVQAMYHLPQAAYKQAWPRLYLAASSKILSYFTAAGLATIQGLQHLRAYAVRTLSHDRHQQLRVTS